jgi:hypothetical protein
MVLRLILVSIVAGLGATPPTESEVGDWSHTVQIWLDARLSEWCVCLPLNEPALRAPAPANQVAPLDDEWLAFFDEEPTLQAPAPAPARNSDTEKVADGGLDALDDELRAFFGEEPAVVLPDPIEDAVAAERAFEAIVDEMVAVFSQGETGSRAAVAETLVQDSATRQAEVDELERAYVEAEAELAKALTDPIVSTPAMTLLPAREDKARELGDEFDLGPAPGPTQTAETIGTPALALEEAPPVGHPAAADPLRDAVRLTRQAALAWMNVLHGPALAALPD